MADSGVYDRWYRTVDGRRVPSAAHGQGKRWQARWRDEDGRQRKQNHDRRADADRALATVKVDLPRGSYVDPRGGRVAFRYVDVWAMFACPSMCDTVWSGHPASSSRLPASCRKS